MMVLIKDECHLQHPDRRRLEKVFDRYFEKYKSLSGHIASLSDTAAGAPALKAAASRIDQSFRDRWAVLLAASRLEETAPEEAERIYEDGVRRLPASPEILGSYANFLYKVRKDYDRAEEMYGRALEADPADATTLGNYAVFLGQVRHDYDRAEEIHRRAVDADPANAASLNNYATFLAYKREDYDRAEEMYRRALGVDPDNPTILGNYATFLADRRNDYERADQMYGRAFDADPDNPNNLGNYTGFLLARGRIEEGLSRLAHVLSLPVLSTRLDLATECWFYAFAHRPPEERLEALGKIKGLVGGGARSPDWDLAQNIERARQDGHPDAAWLEKLADVITEKADISTLDAWDKWRDA